MKRFLSRVSFLTRPDARQHSFLGMSCLLVCHPHLTSIIVLTAVWAQACGLEHRNTFVVIVHLWTICIRDSFLFVSVCWWEQYHDTATSGTDSWDFRNRDNFGLCVLVNWPQCHDTVIFVQDSETGDPQLVAEPGVGRNHGEAMGKS